MELIRLACCGATWVGAERAHCCRRFGGCGAVFDDAELWDAHRRAGRCLDPRELDLVRTKNGIWLRPLDLTPSAEPVPAPKTGRRGTRRAGTGADGPATRRGPTVAGGRRTTGTDEQNGIPTPPGRTPARRSRRTGTAG